MRIEPVRLGLARDAPPDARERLPPRFGNRLLALLAGNEALALSEPAPRPFDGAVDRRIDLILHRTVLRPTDRHDRRLTQEGTASRRAAPASVATGAIARGTRSICTRNGSRRCGLHKPTRAPREQPEHATSSHRWRHAATARAASSFVHERDSAIARCQDSFSKTLSGARPASISGAGYGSNPTVRAVPRQFCRCRRSGGIFR